MGVFRSFSMVMNTYIFGEINGKSRIITMISSQ
jgi:hypothetical protein